jgi:hypothetical protein
MTYHWRSGICCQVFLTQTTTSGGRPSKTTEVGLLARFPQSLLSRPKTPLTGEELQVKFLSDSEENSLKY